MSGKMKVECKRHRWRVGANCGEALMFPGETITKHLCIWCERCGKSFKAYNHSIHEWKQLKTNLNNWRNNKNVRI